MLRATDLADATPITRDRYVDFLRVVSIAVVVLGHWLMAAVEYRDGEFGGGNLLQLEPGAQWLTWVFQVMPVFFLVGGFSNAASWTSARRSSTAYGAWLAGRTARLLRPTVVFAVVWTPLAAFVPDVASSIVALPLWFLSVYLLVVAATPAAAAAHERFGWRAPAALAGAVVVVDALRWGLGVLEPLGWLNFVFVWLFAHQLGLLWRDGMLRRPAALVALGLTGLVVLCTAFGYPLSMVGGPGAARSNNSPPSLALVALATWQAGAVVLLRPRVATWLEHRRVWTGVVAANGICMTLYLWHLTALAVAAALLLPTGLFPQPELAGGAWWSLRPAWFAVLAVALVPFVALFARIEASTRKPVAPRAPVAATFLAAGALSAVALNGFGLVPVGALVVARRLAS